MRFLLASYLIGGRQCPGGNFDAAEFLKRGLKRRGCGRVIENEEGWRLYQWQRATWPLLRSLFLHDSRVISTITLKRGCPRLMACGHNSGEQGPWRER
jgi:hypothetical protein